jgi:Uma2 family endonuclease
MAVLLEAEPPRSLAGTPGPCRKADYFALPDEPRCELLWGHLVVTPAPAPRHQIVLSALAARFRDFALATGHAYLIAPIDVTLSEHTVLQPDLLLVARERRDIIPEGFEGAPDLVVEILSPSSQRRDRLIKLGLYARAAVPEYWIVDPEEQTVELLVLAEDSYRIAPPDLHQLRSRRFPGFEIDLDALWDEVDRMLTGRLPG